MTTVTTIPIIFLHPGELCPHPLNSNEHSPAQIAELAASLETLTQYKNIVVWSPPEEMTVTDEAGQEHILKPGIKYIITGHGLVMAAIKRGWDRLEVKDYTTAWTYEESLLAMEVDNAAPLGSQRNPDQMQANLERAKTLYVDDDRLSRMLDRAKELAGVGFLNPPPSLDTLHQEYGDPQERDFWPMIRVQVSPETMELYQSFMNQIESEDEAVKFERLLGAVDATILGSL